MTASTAKYADGEIAAVVESCGGDFRLAAKRLGCHYRTVYAWRDRQRAEERKAESEKPVAERGSGNPPSAIQHPPSLPTAADGSLSMAEYDRLTSGGHLADWKVKKAAMKEEARRQFGFPSEEELAVVRVLQACRYLEIASVRDAGLARDGLHRYSVDVLASEPLERGEVRLVASRYWARGGDLTAAIRRALYAIRSASTIRLLPTQAKVLLQKAEKELGKMMIDE